MLKPHPEELVLARVRIYCAAACLLTIVGCTDKSSPGAVNGQVAAVVNKGEITVHQVKHGLDRASRLLSDQSADVAGRRVLDSLIDQELVAQVARQQGLNQDPSVIQALQAGEREILANAYLERIVGRAAQPDSDAIDAYYESHPELFARRRIYTLQEFVVSGETARLTQVADISRSAKDSRDFEARLNAAGLMVASRHFAQAAEDLPIGLLASLSKLEIGHSLVIPGPEKTRAFIILDALSAPVDRRTATPAIGRVLFMNAQRKLVAEQIESLRTAAKIDYRGSFADAAKPASLSASAPVL